MKRDSAFSGLEAAIVLIAFVVVAAVFSYVMLGAGFFATQKSQEVTYSGIKQSTSNIVLDGQVYGTWTTSLDSIDLYLSVPQGGQPQKMSEVSFLLTVQNSAVSEITGATIPGGDITTKVLGAGERVQINLPMSPKPTAGQSFTVEIKPKIGASTLITKTLATGYNGGVII